MVDIENLFKELRRTLGNLAASPENQLAYLHSLGDVHNDELAAEFGDHVFPALSGVHRMGYFSDEQMRAIEAVNRQLLLMSGEANADLWTNEAICSAREWDSVRRLATEALSLLSTPA